MTEEPLPDEAGWLLLLRATYITMLSKSVAPGSVVIRAACGHRAFISPSGLAHYQGAGKGLYTVCSDCADVGALLDDDNQQKRMVPGSPEEIRRWKGTAEYDQAMTWAREVGISRPPRREPT